MQDRPQDAVVQYDALRGDNQTGALAAEMHYLAGNALALAAPTPTARPPQLRPPGPRRG